MDDLLLKTTIDGAFDERVQFAKDAGFSGVLFVNFFVIDLINLIDIDGF